MGSIISIANQKGGVGKSTTAQALSAGLSFTGQKTLLIDLDPQGNVTYTTGADPAQGTSYDLLTGNADAREVIQATAQGDVIPAGRMLSRLDIELSATTGKEYRLMEALAPVKEKYQMIVLDTPPALGILTVNAFTASDSVIIPAQADIFSLQGVGQLYDTVEVVRKYCNPTLSIAGILLTRHNTRTILSRDLQDLMAQTAEQIGTSLFTSMIREGIAVKEAQANRQSLFDYSPSSNPAQDYRAFISELAERMGTHAKEFQG